MNAAMLAAITAAFVPYTTLTAAPPVVGCCGGGKGAQPERASMQLGVMVNMRPRLPVGVLSDADVGYCSILADTPHIAAGVPLDTCFWDLARQSKTVTEAEVGQCSE